jgi:hypothetical protein
VRRRHQDWYLTLPESSDIRMMEDERGWFRDMDAELENVRVAMDCAGQNRAPPNVPCVPGRAS